MSCCLFIKVGNTSLCEFIRSSEMFEAFNNIAKYEEWTPCTMEDLNDGYCIILENIENLQKSIKRAKMSLEYLKEAEDIYEMVSSIESYEEDIEKLLEAKAYVNFLKMILEYENNTLQWAIL